MVSVVPGRLSLSEPSGPTIVVARLPFLRILPGGAVFEGAAVVLVAFAGGAGGAANSGAVFCPFSKKSEEDSDCWDWSLVLFGLFASLRVVGDLLVLRNSSSLSPSFAKSAMDLVHLLTSSDREIIASTFSLSLAS